MAQKTASKSAARTTKTTAKKKVAKKKTAKPAAKATKKKAASKRPAGTKAKKAGDAQVKLDRRRKGRREEEAAAAEAAEAVAVATEEKTPAKPALERREKVNRRRQIDPTTCERDYSDSEVEFMNALDEYKRTSGRMFPTCSEVLEVIRGLGYVQLGATELAARGGTESASLEDSAEQEAKEALDASDALRCDETDEAF